MRSVKKILVPLAATGDARGLFNYAAHMATSLDADLIIANVINVNDVHAVGRIVSLGYAVDGDHYISSIEAERETLFEQIVSASDYDSERIKLLFRVGNPVSEILKLIVKKDVDMVIMGVRGHSNLEHFFVGSVAEKVFRRSPVTVVSYRDEETNARYRKKIPLE